MVNEPRFLAIVLARMGNKTQIAKIALAARYTDVVMAVLGTTLGMMLNRNNAGAHSTRFEMWNKESSMLTVRRQFLLATTLVSMGWCGNARAHGTEDHQKNGGPARKEQKAWGIAGDAKAVRRTIDVRMGDHMRFTPDRIEARLGETLRFRVHNAGKVMHEFVIGTKTENAKHAEWMVKFPNMEHDEPYMAHVSPGKTGEIIWTFNRSGTFEFACLIAGHYGAGMVGVIKVSPA